MKRIIKNIVIVLGCLILLSCAAVSQYAKAHNGKSTMHDINGVLNSAYKTDQAANENNVPANVKEALLPSLRVQKPQASAINDEVFDIAVSNEPAAAFFAGLVKGTPFNIVVSPKIVGNISINLKQVTIPEVLKAIKDNYGYQFERTSYGYRILPAELETKVFVVNYLDVNRTGKSNTAVSSGQISQKTDSTSSDSTSSTTGSTTSETSTSVGSSSSIETSSKADFWKELKESLKTIIGDQNGKKVIVNPVAGVVVVRGYPADIKQVAHYIDSIQTTMRRQVILDAKIIEVQLDKGFQAGVDWKALGIQQQGNQKFSDNLDLSSFSSIFTVSGSADHGNFTTLINLLGTQGDVQILSSPRISTLNNQKAVIKVGDDEYYITNVTNTTVTGTSSESSQDVELTPFFSGISLDVTPQIDASGNVLLHIHPVISEVSKKDIEYTMPTGTDGKTAKSSIPSAKSNVRESDNMVFAKNNQIVVIGGLIENRTKNYNANVPLLSKVPVIGKLFQSTNQTSERSELIILLRPIVVGHGTWSKELKNATKRVQDLGAGFKA